MRQKTWSQRIANSESSSFLDRVRWLLPAPLAMLALILAASPSFAEEEVTVPQKEPPSMHLSMLDASSLGDTYDPASGSVGFSVTDVSLPGNSSLPVEFTRTYNAGNKREFQLGTANGNEPWGLGYWSVDVPYVHGIFIDGTQSNIQITQNDGWTADKECTGDVLEFLGIGTGSSATWRVVSPDEWWQGKFLHIPGQVSEALIPGVGLYTGEQVTSTNHKITNCFTRTDGGEGIEAMGPDGTRYRFEHVVERIGPTDSVFLQSARRARFLLATLVTDKFGNTVTYNWTGSRLDSIVGSDGRRIDLAYVNDKLDTVTANGRVWRYAYTNGVLTKVIRPDDRYWEYSLSFYDQREARTRVATSNPDFAWRCEEWLPVGETSSYKQFTVKTPDGALITYGVEDIYHHSYNVDPHAEEPFPGVLTFMNLHCNMRQSLTERIVSFGLEQYHWSYTYSENVGQYVTTDPYGAAANASIIGDPSITFLHTRPGTVPSAAHVKTTTVNGPSNVIVYYVDRDVTSESEGKVLAIDYLEKQPSTTLMKRIESDYSLGSNWGSYCTFLSQYSGENDCLKKNNLLQTNNRVQQDYTRTILYDAGVTSYTYTRSGFDFYGFNEFTAEYNNFSAHSRYTRSAYSHDLSNWVFGQLTSYKVRAVSSGPYTETNRTEYRQISSPGLYANISVPDKLYRFNHLVATYPAYNTDGTLNRIESALGDRWIEYSNYNAGSPQTITTPTADGSGTQNFYRTVDDNGWITSETDFRGNVTNYNYNDVGWLETITQGNSYWLPTSVTYDRLISPESLSGTYAGMLKQVITKGYYEKSVYYDELLRPLITTEWDTRSENTRATTTVAYDADNNVTFSSYPGRDPNPKGVSMIFDAIGRLSSVIKDTDTGAKTATTQYIAGNTIQTIDYKGNIATTEYLAYGAPSYDQAETINEPESVTTSIVYNIFGNVESVTQGGITQHHVYDANQRLCKTVRPDIGNTSYAYNGNGDIEWTAQSASVSSTTTSCDYIVDVDDKITHSYDDLGRLDLLTFGDNSPSKDYVYDADGNLKQLASGTVHQEYFYDDIDNLTRETLDVDSFNSAIDYTFDDAGQLSAITYPTGHVISQAIYSTGHPSMIANITSGTDYATDVQFHPSGDVHQFTYGNGLEYVMDQNTELSPDRFEVISGSTIQVGMQYGYDNNANVDTIDDLQNSTYDLDMTYDGIDRLKTANGYWGVGTYNYDAMGNIDDYSLGAFSLDYVYDASKKLDSVTGSKPYDFSYDERGNVTQSQFAGIIYAYNLANQMTAAGSNAYLYDGHDKRVKKITPSGSQYFHYSRAGKLMYTYTQAGDHINYFYLNGKLIAKDELQPTSGTVVIIPPPSGGVAPTVTLECNPCTASAPAWTYAWISATANATVECENSCLIEWFYNGSSLFNYAGSDASHTFNKGCYGYYSSDSADVWVKATDSVSGESTDSDPVSMSLTCY